MPVCVRTVRVFLDEVVFCRVEFVFEYIVYKLKIPENAPKGSRIPVASVNRDICIQLAADGSCRVSTAVSGENKPQSNPQTIAKAETGVHGGLQNLKVFEN